MSPKSRKLSPHQFGVALATLVCVSVLAIGCGGGGSALSVAEYAELACSLEELAPEDESRTNKEVREAVGDFLKDMDNVTPPDELKDYHELSVEILVAARAILRNLDDDERFSPFSLLPLIGFSEKQEEAEAQLSPETIDVLNSAGCDTLPTAGPTEVGADEQVDPEATPVRTRNFESAEYVIDPVAELYTATIVTAKGEIVIELFVDIAPNTVNSFVFLAERNYFDDLTFHRVEENFVVQGGDPRGNGTGGPGYETADEPNEIRNAAGTIAMAKVQGATTFGSQFFINLKHNSALDFDSGATDSFYPFGRVIEGMEVVQALAVGDVMASVTITRAPNPAAPHAARTFAVAEYVITPQSELYTATIATAKGEIVIELFADIAPNTVNSFVFLAERKYFDGLTFHRVVDDFVVQGGDPLGTGLGGPGYETADEPNEIRNETGTIAMAKAPGSGVFGSQFFINLKDNSALDFDSGGTDSFYPFGRVIEGMEVVQALAEGDVMASVTIARAPNPAAPHAARTVQRGVVPDVIGLPEDVARRAVEEAGYNVTIVHGRSEEYPRGAVFDQAPSAGVELEPGRAVFIAVSEGP